MKKMTIVLISFMMSACTHYAAGPAPMFGAEMGSLDPVVAGQVEELFEEIGVPSMVLAVVVGDGLIWAKGLGERPGWLRADRSVS